MLSKVKRERAVYPEHDLEPCTKIQAASTGRLYLETDIDSVRRLDELAANGLLGKERNGKAMEKDVERGTGRENRTPWEINGCSGMERGKEKRKESPWERDGGIEKEKGKDGGRERPCWEKGRWMERGREKEKKSLFTGNELPPPQLTSSGRNNRCPVFSWPEGFPRMSYRSTSLPRPVNITVSSSTFKGLFQLFHKTLLDVDAMLIGCFTLQYNSE